jgi:hypothetical protein
MTQINVDSKSRANCKDALPTPNNKMFESVKNHVISNNRDYLLKKF